ncbi:hypothetical protein AM593_01379, partial [Mytilus galloprovincialis]
LCGNDVVARKIVDGGRVLGILTCIKDSENTLHFCCIHRKRYQDDLVTGSFRYDFIGYCDYTLHFNCVRCGEASTSSFLPESYIYMNLFVLLIGVLANVHSKSEEAVFLFFVLHCITIGQDMLFIGIYQPIGDATYEVPKQPITAFLMYKVWQERRGKPVQLPCNIPWIVASAPTIKRKKRSSNSSEADSEM